MCQPLIDKIKQKMTLWVVKKIVLCQYENTLINSVIAGLVKLFGFCFCPAKAHIHEIETLCNPFLWSGTVVPWTKRNCALLLGNLFASLWRMGVSLLGIKLNVANGYGDHILRFLFLFNGPKNNFFMVRICLMFSHFQVMLGMEDVVQTKGGDHSESKDV